MPRTRLWAALARVLAPSLLLVAGACRSPDEISRLTFSGRVMGTTYSVKVVTEVPLAVGDQEAMAEEIQTMLDLVDGAMSTYRDDSELSRLNQAPAGQPFALVRGTFDVLAQAMEIGRRSRGGFDVTVGPLVNLWGFGPNGEVLEPDPATLAAALASTGAHQLLLDPAAAQVTKNTEAVYVDLSGIAKGHGVDQVAARLSDRGLDRFLVEVGGEMRARGANAAGAPWQIGIERPDAERGITEHVVPLRDLALATSGDYRNYREVDGRRVSHLIDPRTGVPIDHRLASVTVMAPTCAEADAWATALSILGPEEGRAVADLEQIAALMLVRRDDGAFETVTTPAYDRYLQSLDPQRSPHALTIE